jgi:hypothetical protein
MPYSIAIERYGIYCKCHGTLTKDEISKLFESIHLHENYKRLLYIIYDLTEVLDTKIDPTDITLLGANHVGASLANTKLVDILVRKETVLTKVLFNSVIPKLLPNGILQLETLALAREKADDLVMQHTG